MHVSETHNYFSFFTKLLSSNYTLHVNCKQSTISPLYLTILSRGQISHVVHARMFWYLLAQLNYIPKKIRDYYLWWTKIEMKLKLP